MDHLCCGLTGIIARRRAPEDTVSADAKVLQKWFAQIDGNGLQECRNRNLSFADQYMGGEKPVRELWEAITRLKRPHEFYLLFSDDHYRAALESVSNHLDQVIQRESALLSEQMGYLSADTFDYVSRRIETVKDAAWCLKSEIFGNIEKIHAFLPSQMKNPDPAALVAVQEINAVLNSIDRLEVRGRDSAGISLLFCLDAETYTTFSNTLEKSSLTSEFTSRMIPAVLLNRGITVHHLPDEKEKGRRTAIGMIYKVAKEIGSLGDNIRFLREQMQNDKILQTLLFLPNRSFTICAHTRWASVGEINEANCHPVDNRTITAVDPDTGIIHVCLNGDIDNYQSIKARHEKAGIVFPEEITCDTKIIPVHVASYVKKGHDIAEAFRLAVNDFDGSHAIAMHTDLAPGKMFLALKGSGQAIFVGLTPDYYMPTSEVYGFVESTSRYLKMDGETVRQGVDGQPVNGQIFILGPSADGDLKGVTAMFYDGAPIELSEKDVRTTQLTSRDIDRQDFDHYFLKEISESPASVRKTLENRWKIIDDKDRRYEIELDASVVPVAIQNALTEDRIRRILFIGQGTAGIAAQACADLMRHYINDPSIRIEALKSSELSGFVIEDSPESKMDDTLLIPISQSGTTADTNRTVDMVRKKGAWSIAIVNRRDSDLTFKTSGVLYTSSGRDIEMSVASTKAFYSQIIAGALLGLYIVQLTNRRTKGFVSNEIKEMIAIPDLMEQVLSMTDSIKASAQRLALQRTYWAVVGSGPNKAAADEIRIKLSELCYKTISSDYVEDKKHIDLSSEPLIIVCAAGTRRSVIGDIVKDTAIFRSHKAIPVVIADAQEDRFDAYATDVFHVPSVAEHFAMILNTLVGHMWGYYAALTINEGSHFLNAFREDIRQTIQSYSDKNLDIFEIALEKPLREKIMRFYAEFRKRQSENRLPATIGIQPATDLTLLLKYLSGRLPVTDFELDFGVKGTARNMFTKLFEALGEAINTMIRPVDAIKHQAKTVTVGTSRIEEKTEGLLFDNLKEYGFGIDQLTITNIAVLKNLQTILSGIKGATLYRISGINLLGEPTDNTTIDVIKKAGSSAAIPSRTAKDRTLKGSKRIIVRRGNVYIGKGRKDNRSILVIPLISSDPFRPNIIEHLLLLDIDFKADVDLTAKVKALGGKYEHIKSLVQENSIQWKDEYLERVPIDDLFGRSAEKIAEAIVSVLSKSD